METDDRPEWLKFIDEGAAYLSTAVNGAEKRKAVFTPEILYNIIAMSIEKNIMGYLFYHKCLPDNHTLGDLVTAVRQLSPFEKELFDRLTVMDNFQEICSIDFYERKIPSEEDLADFLETGNFVRGFVESKLPL